MNEEDKTEALRTIALSAVVFAGAIEKASDKIHGLNIGARPKTKVLNALLSVLREFRDTAAKEITKLDPPACTNLYPARKPGAVTKGAPRRKP